MCPAKTILGLLHILLRSFTHHNIDVTCALLETCGRFLYRSPDTHVRTKLLVQIMIKKKAKMHLDERQNTMIQNAFFYCNPPEVARAKRKERPPLHEYLRALLFKQLSVRTLDAILRQMRRLPWADPDFLDYAVICFTR